MPEIIEPSELSPSGTLAGKSDSGRANAAHGGQFMTLKAAHLQGRRRRRIILPLVLFAVTCLSTFWAGVTGWSIGTPIVDEYSASLNSFTVPFYRGVIRHGGQGLVYMGCVLAILLAHEMGHFVATVRHRIPASFPFFIPFPGSPFGTMGAVIGMDGLRANRRELFDIGIAGPVAGLVVAIPILWVGISRLDLNQPQTGGLILDTPIVVNLLLDHIQPDGYVTAKNPWTAQKLANNQINPYFMAGWMGLLITGVNMLPISQLDGGHVTYTLFGKWAHWIARGFLFLAIIYVVFFEVHIWFLMIVIVILIGTDHPPTSNDRMSLGPVRTAFGLVSLLIPILCFPPRGMELIGM